MKKFEVGEILRFSYEKTKENLVFLAKVAFVFGVVYLLTNLDFRETPENPFTDTERLFVIVYSIFGSLVSVFLNIGKIRIALNLIDKKKASLKMLFSGKDIYWNFLVGSILYFLIVVAGVIFLVIPGIIWSVKYSQWSYLMIEEGLSPVDAIKKSGKITSGNKGNIFLYAVVMIVFNILGALPLLLGLLFTVPMTWLGYAKIYRKLNISSKNS